MYHPHLNHPPPFPSPLGGGRVRVRGKGEYYWID